MGRIKLIISAVLVISLSFSAFCQELVYDVSIQGKHVGNMLVTKKVLDSGRVYFSAIMDLEYQLFRPMQTVQLQEAVYRNDTLLQAYFVDKRNGELVQETKIEQLAGRKYYQTTQDTSKGWHEKPILKSFLTLYFNKPLKRDSAFSEITHQYCKIAKLPEENRFMMLNNENEKAILEYNEKGICIGRNFKVGAVEYVVKLKDNELK